MSGFKDATIIYRFGYLLGRSCFRAFGRMDVVGAECVPRYGPLIVVRKQVAIGIGKSTLSLKVLFVVDEVYLNTFFGD